MRFFTTLALTLSCLTIFHGHSQAAEQIELKVDYSQPNTVKAVHADLAEAFMKAHPDIKITFRTPVDSYQTLAQQEMRDQLVGNLPDVAFVGTNTIPLLASRGLLADLNGFVTNGEAGWLDMGYEKPMRDLCSVDGRIYAIPFQLAVPVIFFNADLVRQSGWNESLPETWEGVFRLARQIRSQDKEKYGFFYQWDGGGDYWWQALVSSSGGRMLDDHGKAGFDTPEGLAGMTLLQRFVTEAEMPYITTTQASQLFYAGKIGMMAVSSGWLGSFTKGAEGHFEIAARPFPVAANGHVPFGGNAAAILTRDPKRQAAAWEYVRFVSNYASQTEVVKRVGYLSGNRQVASEISRLHPALAAAARSLPQAEPWVDFPGANGLAIADLMKLYKENVVSGKSDPATALREMADETNKRLP